MWVILETYLNSVSKNASETDIFPHGTKSLLSSVIKRTFLEEKSFFSAVSRFPLEGFF